ncbi:MAG: hypothetical protein GY841_12115 [FCB group bacterium]|nr:hypothetical protein [FCB group bacterium]
MIVKSFTADTVAGALKKVRSDLGGEAMILKTRRLPQDQQMVTGAKVEVTACLDKNPAGRTSSPATATVAPAEKPVTSGPSVPADAIVQKLDFLIDIFQTPVRKSSFPGNIGRLFSALLQADIPETMAYDLTEKIGSRFEADDDFNTIAGTAVELLVDQLPKSRGSYLFKTGQKIAVIGPAGGGKTSLIGRLAGYLIGERKLPVCLTSLDKIKVAAPEELATYADLLNADHFDMPGEIDRSLLNRHSRDKVTLIDTPALNARDRSEISIFAEKLGRIKPDRVIAVFPATFRSTDLFDMQRSYRPLKPTELAITMTDQTCRLGAMIAASIHTGLPLTILGTGRKAGCLDLAPDSRQIIRTFLGLDAEGSHE